jgi:hypothetical protein
LSAATVNRTRSSNNSTWSKRHTALRRGAGRRDGGWKAGTNAAGRITSRNLFLGGNGNPPGRARCPSRRRTPLAGRARQAPPQGRLESLASRGRRTARRAALALAWRRELGRVL